MSRQDERRPMLSDEAIRRALRPGTDIGAPADFAARVEAAIAGRPQHRRFWQVAAGPSSRQLVVVGQLLLLLALLLAVVIGAFIVGSLRDERIGGGPLLVAQSNELSWIDPQSRTSTPLIDDPRGIFGVARSTDGGSVSFWTGIGEQSGTTLELVGVDGTGRRVLATNVTPKPVGRGSIDVWSSDDRYLAAAVTAGGVHRILVVDVASGDGQLIGPDDGADNPLWSPDGEWLAFTHEHAGSPNTLAVMRRDGSGGREISTNVDARVSGPDNWSADGTWIYFDAGRDDLPSIDIYRTDVDSGLAEQLTFQVPAAAPALSPDESQVAFMLWTPTRDGSNPSVWVMTSDGSEPRQLVPDADLRGWSPDGHYVLVVTPPSGGPVELLAITPDGSERNVLLSLDSCPEPCLHSLSWGWPRP